LAPIFPSETLRFLKNLGAVAYPTQAQMGLLWLFTPTPPLRPEAIERKHPLPSKG